MFRTVVARACELAGLPVRAGLPTERARGSACSAP
jgi:hypothetical protein